ncbi:hypothetical protein [Halovivax sp.]|uniref:hypothetical protein n=1 Tax=Halovivax sp. TaxID=1935978 RepID=UPI0025C6A8DB|nr:hypothetical protein [Halovivax sp.]
MVGTTIELHFGNAAAERRFTDSYLPDAWERYENAEYWDRGWFWAYGQVAEYDVGVDGGLVRLVFDGDPDGLLDAEADQWEAFEGLESWECTRYDEIEDGESYESLLAQQRDAKGPVGGEYEYRYKPLTSRLALDYRCEFDESLAAAPEPTEQNPLGLGFWSLLHSLFVQCGYDWYEENDACLWAMESRVKSIAAYHGAEAAREEYERLRTTWTEFEDELDDWLDDTEAGTTSV